MKQFLVIFSFLFLSNFSQASEDIIFIDENPSNASLLASESLPINNKEKFTDSSSFLSLGWALQQGNFYFGTGKTPMEFNSINLNYLYAPSSLSWVIDFDYLFNKSQTRIANFNGGLGYNVQLNSDIKINSSILFGYSNYQENSSFQNVSFSGYLIGLRGDLFYKLSQEYSLNFNLKWNHQMFTNGVKYWGSDPTKEIVFEFNSIGIGLTKEW